MQKTFRLFISSTFNDFRREREILQTKVFPIIKEYASLNNYIFQPIDLRWGLSNEAQLNQKTLELCLDEVRSCKRYMHPNFLVMIGDRYGWVSLPYAINSEEFEELLTFMSKEESSLLLEWYKKDLNQLSKIGFASYVIKERTGVYEDFDTWSEIETELRKILQAAVVSSDIDEEKQRKYFLSATEAEVEEGIIPYIKPTTFQERELLNKNKNLIRKDSQHIFGFFRNIDKATRIEDKFIVNTEKEMTEKVECDYHQAQEFKKRVSKVLNNTLEVDTKQTTKELLDEDYLEIKNPKLDDETLEDFLLRVKDEDIFEYRLTLFLKKQFDEQKALDEENNHTILELELSAQRNFAENKRKNFLGQEKLKNIISSYINDDSTQSLVLYGESGKGKSALISESINECNRLQSKIFYRFVGATPGSSSSKDILSSLFEEIGIDIKSKQQDKETFDEFSQRVKSEILNIEEKIVIFIDAVDQLHNDDQFIWLPKELPSNVKIILSALEDDKYPEDTKYLQALKSKTENLHLISAFNEGEALLDLLLKKENRSIDDFQRKYFLKQYNKVKSPLYVVIAFQEIKNWKSGDKTQKLAATQSKIIEEFINNLTKVYHHNKKFVTKVLGYIYASKDGISESELLQLLEIDEDFVKIMADEKFHRNYTLELPLVHWSRLYSQLKYFLSLKTQYGEEVMYFFHREFDSVFKIKKNLKSTRLEHEAMINSTQKLIILKQNNNFNSNRLGKLYITLIAEYGLRYKNKRKQTEFSKFISTIENGSWVNHFFYYLNNLSLHYIDSNRIDKAIRYLNIYEIAAYSIFHNEQKNEKSISNYFTETEIENIGFSSNLTWAGFFCVQADMVLGVAYTKINKLTFAIKYLKKSLKLGKELLLTDEKNFVGIYTSILVGLSNTYTSSNQLSKSKKLLEEGMEYSEKYYIEGDEESEKEYISLSINLAQLNILEGKHNDAIVVLDKILIFVESINEKYATSKWIKYYIQVLTLLSRANHWVNKGDISIEKGEQALNIVKPLYEQNSKLWVESYILILSDLARPYSDKKNKRALELSFECLSITEDLFKKDKELWAEKYSKSLHLYSYILKIFNDLDNAIFYQERCLEIRKLLFIDEKEKWGALYLEISKNLINSYEEKGNSEEKIILLNMDSLEAVKYLFDDNSIQWVDKYLDILIAVALLFKAMPLGISKAIEFEEEAKTIVEDFLTHDNDTLVSLYTQILINLSTSYSTIEPKRSYLIDKKCYEFLTPLYNTEKEKWAKTYSTVLYNLALSYSNFGKQKESLLLKQKNVQLCEDNYNISNHLWGEDYIRALHSLGISYYKIDDFANALEQFKEEYKICQKIYDEYNPKRDQALQFINSIKQQVGSNKSTAEDSMSDDLMSLLGGMMGSPEMDRVRQLYDIVNAPTPNNGIEEARLSDILNLAKFITYHKKNEEITATEYIEAVGFIELNGFGYKFFSTIMDLDDIGDQEDAISCIKYSNVLDDLPIADELIGSVNYAKVMLGDNIIGSLR